MVDFFQRLWGKKTVDNVWQGMWAELAQADDADVLSKMVYWDDKLRYTSHTLPRLENRAMDWLDLGHSNGYIREQALRGLPAAVPNAFCFALLLRRLNDWVPEVRAAAWQKLPLCAAATQPQHVVDALFAIVPHWWAWANLDDEARVEVLTMLCQDDVLQRMISAIQTRRTGAMKRFLAQLGHLPAVDNYLHDLAKNAAQPAVRAKVYEALLSGKMRWFAGWQKMWIDKRYGKYRLAPSLNERALTCSIDHTAILDDAVHDKSPMVRRIAAEAIMRELPNVSAASRRWAEILAADRVPSVAERGQFIVRKIG